MGTVNFYHLEQSGLDQAIRPLLDRALAQGWRVMLRSGNRARLEELDRRLWQGPEESFLAHGVEGDGHEARQPVLLGAGAATNGANALMLLGGERVDPEEARAMERVWLLFEAHDQTQVEAARQEWRAVVAAGLVAQYWSDASGRWEKKAESGAPAG